MNKNVIITIIIVLAIAIGGYALVKSMPNQDTPSTNDTDAMMEGDQMMEDDSDSMMEEDSMMEDEDAMMKDEDSMMEGDSMMEAGVKTFEVSGTNFAFSLEEIRVKKGDKVTINFVSADGFHDWVVDEFNAATEKVQTGEKTSVTFVADQEGMFEYYCSVGQHRANGMVGTLIVE